MWRFMLTDSVGSNRELPSFSVRGGTFLSHCMDQWHLSQSMQSIGRSSSFDKIMEQTHHNIPLLFRNSSHIQLYNGLIIYWVWMLFREKEHATHELLACLDAMKNINSTCLTADLYALQNTSIGDCLHAGKILTDNKLGIDEIVGIHDEATGARFIGDVAPRQTDDHTYAYKNIPNSNLKNMGPGYVPKNNYINFYKLNINLCNWDRAIKLRYHFAIQDDDENKDESKNNDNNNNKKSKRPKHIPKNNTIWYNTIRNQYDIWD
eukprot:450398_1